MNESLVVFPPPEITHFQDFCSYFIIPFIQIYSHLLNPEPAISDTPVKVDNQTKMFILTICWRSHWRLYCYTDDRIGKCWHATFRCWYWFFKVLDKTIGFASLLEQKYLICLIIQSTVKSTVAPGEWNSNCLSNPRNNSFWGYLFLFYYSNCPNGYIAKT